MTALRAALVLLALLLGATAARAERVVTSISNQAVAITQSFSGETMTLFGSIEPDFGSEQRFVEGPFDVIVVVTGPLGDRVTRRMTHNFGLWMNTEQVAFHGVPSYFRVLSSRKLSQITNATTLAVENIMPEDHARRAAQADWWNSVVFGNQLVRLMTERGLYGIDEGAVRFLSNTLYATRVTLPSDIPNGPYLAYTYVFKNGAIVARSVDGFSVRKAGFERFLGTSATGQPLLYGITCVALALATGWLGGVVFKR